MSLRDAVKKALPTGVVSVVRSFLGRGLEDEQWARTVMNPRVEELVRSLDPSTKSALEISGNTWSRRANFKKFKALDYPDYDVCAGPVPGEKFDVIIAEQVFEHLLWPYRAVKNVYDSLNAGGAFVISTPFLLKVHNYPVDCSRWTEIGLRHLLAEGGFPMENIVTESWGNRACIKANWPRWQVYQSWRHSLKNEPEYPIVVWALARK